MSKSMDLQKKLKLFRVSTRYTNEKRNCLKQVSPQEERKLCLKLIVNPYPKIRYAKHTHTGVRVSLREVAVMRDTEHKGEGRAWTFYRRNVPARPPTIDEQREERKKKGSAEGLKESSHVSASRRWNGNECSSR